MDAGRAQNYSTPNTKVPGLAQSGNQSDTARFTANLRTRSRESAGGSFTPSSLRRPRRHHHRLHRRRLCLPLRLLLRPALFGGGHQHLRPDRKEPTQAIVDVFWSLPNGTPRTKVFTQASPMPQHEELFEGRSGMHYGTVATETCSRDTPVFRIDHPSSGEKTHCVDCGSPISEARLWAGALILTSAALFRGWADLLLISKLKAFFKQQLNSPQRRNGNRAIAGVTSLLHSLAP
jgi:hypothetical protein